MSAPRKLDEALTDALRGEKAPEALRQRLLAEARRRDAGQRSAFRPWLAAAAVVLALGGSAVLARRLRPVPAPLDAEAMPDLLEATSRNYQTVKSLDFRGPECTDKACGLWALHRVGFTAPVPASLANAPLAGGRSCSVMGRPVAYYAFRDGRSVYVFRDPLPACGEGAGISKSLSGVMQVRAWNEQGRGYVLLEPGR